MSILTQSDSALVIIDVQHCYLELNFHSTVQKNLIETLSQLIDEAQTNGVPVYFISHYFTHPLAKLFFRLFYKRAGEPGHPFSDIHPTLLKPFSNHPSLASLIFKKNTANAFQSTSFESTLRTRGIRHLYIAGLDGSACVYATTKGALDLGFSVSMIDRAIISAHPKFWELRKNQLKKHPALQWIL